MTAQSSIVNYRLNFVLLFLPWAAACLLENNSVLSYLVAWGGSFWILYISIMGKVKPLPKDLPILAQLMRPIFIPQLIFAGYLALTSIFFFLDQKGYYYLSSKADFVVDQSMLELIAQCQRYYCLAHAAFTTGILIGMDYTKQPLWQISAKSLSALLLRLSFGVTILAFITGILPGMHQFAIKLEELSFVAAVLSLALAIPEGKMVNTSIAATIFGINMTNAFLSGWKEQIIVPLIMLGAYLYPYYKRSVSFIFPALIVLFFIFIPTYNRVFRNLAWSGEADSQTAAKAAIEAISSGEEELGENNWRFLTGRLSEIGMFVKYVDRVPDEIDFYGLTIVQQAFESMIPRVLWPNKPITESLVMERVYQIGIVDRASIVSAKPPLITDGYLSGGSIAIFILALLLGYGASQISVTCESLFGNYIFGTALVYTGLFQIFWRGNCFEFMLNSVFWSMVLMFLLFYIGRYLGLIIRRKSILISD
jgi:hypothetical protein